MPSDKRATSAPVEAYIQEWSRNMSNGLAAAMEPTSPNGVFSAACWIHTDFSPRSPLLGGLNFIDAFTGWFYGERGANQTKMQDTCGVLCNPSCPH